MQSWVEQLPEIDESTKEKLRTRLEDELIDVHALADLTHAEFVDLGMIKVRSALAASMMISTEKLDTLVSSVEDESC